MKSKCEWTLFYIVVDMAANSGTGFGVVWDGNCLAGGGGG